MDIDAPGGGAGPEEEEAAVEEAATRCLFEEADELQALIAAIVQASSGDSHSEARFDRARAILDKYQEMPQLLNPYLEALLAPLVQAVALAVASPEDHGVDLPTVARLIYVVSKVRGYKSVVSYFPHEVRFLEPVLHFYLQQKRESELWELRYSLLLWLSNVVLIPFHLATVDSHVLPEGLVGSMVDACQAALSETSIVREGAAFLLARLLTRPDTRQPLHRFLAWAAPALAGAATGGGQMFLEVGVLLTLAHLLKYGQRQELLPHMEAVAAIVLHHTSSSSGTLRSKLLLKVAQRIATTYLPVRQAAWRYNRGTRSLAANLSQAQGITSQGAGQPMECDGPQDQEEEAVDVPELVEEIVGLLLEGLRHRDTVVRWSAAKGLGRISQRLPKENAADVLEALLSSCFDLYEADSGWHGGCLCLAELARRGVLLPGALPQVVPVVLRSLTYSLLKTSHAVGAHVRDAACYVCWAFARAYRPEDVQQYVVSVAQQLIVTAVFDREVNVRRAAAAAFQECVGRLGTFPHGIDLVQLTDYFALANRGHAFTVLAPRIAAFNSYCPAMIDHLLEHKLSHWDAEVRELASKALALLVVQLPAPEAVSSALPRLLPRCLSPASDERHGAILGVAEIMLQVWGCHPHLSQGEGSAALLEEALQLVPRIEAERLYRGKGGDKVRVAVCRLIECVAEARLTLPELALGPPAGAGRGPPARPQRVRAVVKYLDSLEGHLTHLQPQVQHAGVAALRAFARQYFPAWTPDLHEPLLRRLLEGLAPTKTPNVRRGVALGLGALPKAVLSHGEVFDTIASALQRAITIEEDADARDAEARANAVKGLCDVCCTVDVSYTAAHNARGHGVHGGNLRVLFDGLLAGLDDYCTDNRGDVGSFARCAALEGCLRVLEHVGESDARRPAAGSPLLTEELWLAFLKATLKQLMEKIDRVRAVAGSVLQRAVASHHIPADFPHKALLLDAIQRQERAQAADLAAKGQPTDAAVAGALDWSAPSATFPLLVPLLLPLRPLVRPVLEGLVISVGGLSMHVVRAASAALVSTLKALPRDGEVNLPVVSDVLVQMFGRHAQDDRVMLPLLNTLDVLLTHQLLPPGDLLRVLESVKAELAGGPKKDVNKLLAAVKVACGLLGTPPGLGAPPPLREGCLAFLLAMLGNRFPKVRTRTAQQLYSTLLTYPEHFSDIPEESFDRVLEILLDGTWDSSDAASVRRQRDSLYPLLGVAKPAAAAPAEATGPKRKPTRPVDEGYASLVREMGY